MCYDYSEYLQLFLIGMQPRNSKDVAEFYDEYSKSVRMTFYTTSRLKGCDNSWRCGTASCLRTCSGGGFSGARQSADGRHERRGIAWLVVQIPTSQERTVTIELMCFVYQKCMFCPCLQTDFTLTFCSLQIWLRNIPSGSFVKIIASSSVLLSGW